MEVAATHTSPTPLVVYALTTGQPMVSALSTLTCASTIRDPDQTELLHTWLQPRTSATSWATLRIASMTSSDETLPSLRTIRTCWTPDCRYPSRSFRRTTVKCSETRRTSCKNCTKRRSTAPAPATSVPWWRLRTKVVTLATARWRWTFHLTTACRSPATPLTCEHQGR